MICPQTKEQCRNHVTCSAIEECLHPSGGKLPPKPSIEDIERLVDVFGEAVQSLCHFDECGTGYGRPELEVERDAARADLIDFARRMGVE